MKKYIIYATVAGRNYFMCLINGTPTVKNGPSDDQIMQFDDYDTAKTIADRNSTKDYKYQVKEINFNHV